MATPTGIPDISKPGYYDTKGATKPQEAYDVVSTNIKTPTIPTGAKQVYKKGTVGTGEI